MYYKKGSDGKPFYDLYNKKEDSSYQFPFDNSNLNVKQFGHWIGGPSRLQYVSYSFNGHQPGQENWNPSQSKYGLAVSEYVEQNLKTMALSGYLAIRNIFNPSVLIEWDTKQGDCEILNIHKEIVYYRKHDELWCVPILQGKELGEHKLLLKGENVPGVHFMFVRDN